MKKEKALTLKTLNKSNVWDIQENDVFRLWEMAERDSDLKDNQRYYLQVVKSAFDIEEVKVDRPEVIKKLEERGYKIGTMRMDEEKKKWAVKKRPIMRLNDLTYENIHHISAANLPADRLHKKGGMYEKMLKEGYSVLEVPKGTWTEAIFAKEKPKVEKFRSVHDDEEELDKRNGMDSYDDGMDDDDDAPEIEDRYNELDDDDDTFDDDKLTEESYHTTFEEPEDLGLEDVTDDDDY